MDITKIKRCAIYIRVSTEEQHLNGLSLQAQRKALTAYAKEHNYVIVDVYADEGISARKSMNHRKELLRLLSDVEKGKVDMILVTKLDRWFRNIKDYNTTEEILAAHRCYWKTIFENYDSSTANGQMVINIMLSVNQAECDRTSERIKAVLDYKRSVGEVTSGRIACFGYKAVNGHLFKDESTMNLVDEMFQYYFGCMNKRRTYQHLLEEFGDLVPPYATFAKLFTRETYTGTVQGIPDACEPYITQEQYRLIQQISDTRTSAEEHEAYFFSGLIKCPVCGKNLCGYVKKNRKKNGKVFLYKSYRCYNHMKNRRLCSCGMTIHENTVEKYMLEQVPVTLDTTIQMEEARKRRVSNQGRILGLQSELDRLNIQFQKGRISESYYDEQYDMIKKKLDTEQSSGPHTVIAEYVTELLSGNWICLYDQLDAEHKSVFWKTVVSEINIDKTHRLCGFKFNTEVV
ncbi:recombinase family protein [Hespellia stercorisuis]|uniref:Site-specific DNA recombinase n=1 Tax=Hespellia stercorisuis DSM 15480 TaxID=1121950 RepID=A0A1M6TSC6_9FIRM|nr:recombinase family protein [Hespellia stercorisuis]SHK59837.1 Site-specific DNA recombinase [Hespellia stercorisuis DSM 15480]